MAHTVQRSVAFYPAAHAALTHGLQDIYEFIQRRSDWKKIEKTVDKTMYNLSFKEDCVVC